MAFSQLVAFPVASIVLQILSFVTAALLKNRECWRKCSKERNVK